MSKLYCGTAGPSDALRYGAPGGRIRTAAEKRPVVVWNCTQRCNLQCVHCYSMSGSDCPADETTTSQGEALIDDLAAFGAPVLLFSGGEPLLRPDLLHLAEYASRRGLRTAVSTNGTLIDKPTAARMKRAGVGYAGISVDGMRRTHDRFRGQPGAFARAVQAARNCLSVGLKAGLRFTVSRRNAADLPGIFDLVRDEGIPRVCVYHLVHSGRGAELLGDRLDHAATRQVVDLVADRTASLRAEGAMTEVLTVDNHADGPYLYLRMLRENRPGAAEALRLLRRNGGNSSGVGIGCVSWDGTVYPDPFWRNAPLGNVRERPFSEIWTDLSNPFVARLKNKSPHLAGRCRLCGFLDACGGNLRARAEALTGDAWASDPACYLTDGEIAAGQEELVPPATSAAREGARP